MGSAPKITLPPTPAPPPDYADQAIRDSALRERQKQLSGASRRKSFVTGAGLGPSVVPGVASKSLLGQ